MSVTVLTIGGRFFRDTLYIKLSVRFVEISSLRVESK